MSAEKTSEKLHEMFQKADDRLSKLQRNLQASDSSNVVDMLQQLHEVKDDYANLVEESVKIKRDHQEAKEFVSKEMQVLMEALSKLQYVTGHTIEPSEELTKLTDEIPVNLPSTSTGFMPINPISVKECQQNNTSDKCEKPVNSQKSVQRKLEKSLSSAPSFQPVNVEQFQSVSGLLRGRLKLDDVNTVYQTLWNFFTKNSKCETISVKEMTGMGLKITGHSGEAKLKVLRQLGLLEMNTSGNVRLY